MTPILHIVLYNPQIPQNTGNIGRLSSILNARLHLIHPLGFTITDSKLKRSGMDYWKELDVHHHENWDAYLNSNLKSNGIHWLLTTKSKTPLYDAKFSVGDAIIFGSEDKGVPQSIHDLLNDSRITIPQPNKNLRSLNLSTSVGIVAYEFYRQVCHVYPHP